MLHPNPHYGGASRQQCHGRLYLEIVIMQDFDEWVSEIWDLHAFFNAVDEENGVHMGSYVVQEACDEGWREWDVRLEVYIFNNFWR